MRDDDVERVARRSRRRRLDGTVEGFERGEVGIERCEEWKRREAQTPSPHTSGKRNWPITGARRRFTEQTSYLPTYLPTVNIIPFPLDSFAQPSNPPNLPSCETTKAFTMSAPFAMMRTRMMMRAQPSRILQMHQQRFMGSFKPTARVMSPVPVCTDEACHA